MYVVGCVQRGITQGIILNYYKSVGRLFHIVMHSSWHKGAFEMVGMGCSVADYV